MEIHNQFEYWQIKRINQSHRDVFVNMVCDVGGIMNNIISYQIQNQMKRKVDSCGISKQPFSKYKQSVKTEPIDEVKQNFNFNDIRESSYKLPKSKSGRKDHSLQRKKPLKYLYIKEDTSIKGRKEKEQENSLHNTISFTSPSIVSHHLQETSTKFSFNRTQNIAKQLKTYNVLPLSKQKGQHLEQQSYFQCSDLQAEQIVLKHIETMWESSTKIQLRSFFQEQMSAIQNILKKLIINMTNPKIQDQSTLKSPLLNQTQTDNLISFRNSTAINATILKDDNSEQSPRGSIELKKIMYILEDKRKQSKKTESTFHMEQMVDTPPQNFKTVPCENHSLQDVTIFSTNTWSKELENDRNCLVSELKPFYNDEEDKINNNCNNNRIYLKNIVKKGKVTGMNLSDGLHCEKQSISYKSVQKKTKSGDISCNNLKETTSINDKYELDDNQLFEESQQTLETETVKINLDHPITQKSDIEKQPKRVVLNQIISMLNVKYNKSIKLEPRQT